MAKPALITARIMLAALFVLAGINKLTSISATSEYIETASVLPGFLAAPTGVFELVSGILLALGKFPRIVAPIMSGFTLLTIAFFHYDFSQQIEVTLALKNLAIAGGLLMVFAYEEAARQSPSA
ncbi:DoxX family protein [Erythrobacter sp. W53]|uniref:DoxX family protein n=1 Tax=Erythrobacteraceae TaxID=335929 RepID=UPI0036D21501